MDFKLSHPLQDNLNYGIIGNCKSSALINEDSSIDWCCLPQFDSPSVFGKIIDENIGGHFKIECDDDYVITQTYIKNTAILCTRFESDAHAFEVLDFTRDGNSDVLRSTPKFSIGS